VVFCPKPSAAKAGDAEYSDEAIRNPIRTNVLFIPYISEKNDKFHSPYNPLYYTKNLK
jgi:hypothetical protein